MLMDLMLGEEMPTSLWADLIDEVIRRGNCNADTEHRQPAEERDHQRAGRAYADYIAQWFVDFGALYRLLAVARIRRERKRLRKYGAYGRCSCLRAAKDNARHLERILAAPSKLA